MNRTFTQTTDTIAEQMKDVRIGNINPNNARLIFTDEREGITQEGFRNPPTSLFERIPEPESETRET